jgi:hypothetical protein
MEKTIDAATYRDLNGSLDKLTKNIQLLSGKAIEERRPDHPCRICKRLFR